MVLYPLTRALGAGVVRVTEAMGYVTVPRAPTRIAPNDDLIALATFGADRSQAKGEHGFRHGARFPSTVG
jgi:hypothetical protein